jgi:hypothetical protein
LGWADFEWQIYTQAMRWVMSTLGETDFATVVQYVTGMLLNAFVTFGMRALQGLS